MNNFKTYILLVAMAIAIVSCTDKIIVDNPTQPSTGNHVTSVAEAEKRLNEAYDIMRSADAYSGKMVFYGDVAGDDMMASSPSSLSADFYLLNYTPETSPEAMWDLPYLIISKCNEIINGIDLLEGTQGEIKNYYKGQALALRGMLLFELTRIYALPYNRDKGASPGVPIILSEESLANKNIRQNTVAECYNAIISDLNESISLLDNTKGAEYHKGRISRWGVMSLLSRVYLYHSDNKKAYDMAVRAIDGAETDGYRLWTNTEYATAWSNDPTETQKGEVLFEIVNTTDNSQGGKTLGHLHSPEGGKDIVVTSYFHYTLRKDKKDVRLKLLKYSNGQAFVNKYQPQDGETAEYANIPLLRLSETYLNAAEAAAKLGNNDNAIKYLDPIVRRANPQETVQGQDITVSTVSKQRQKELVGEGHRLYDAIRDGDYVYRRDKSGQKEISLTKHFVTQSQKTRFYWRYFRCALPIPQKATDSYENIEQIVKLSSDGPYIIYKPDETTQIISVDEKGNIKTELFERLPANYSFNVVSSDGKHRFPVTLHEIKRPDWNRDITAKTFVTSDPHSDFDSFVTMLQGNGVIDSNYKWTYGSNRLVVIGDIFDRGDDATQILWLLYKLEKEAEDAGGSADYLLGNHDIMVLYDNILYTENKYKLLIEKLNTRYCDLLARDTELGKWLSTRNSMMTIGRNLFVHAGISEEMARMQLSIPEINEEISKSLYIDKSELKVQNPLGYYLIASDGPLWYRGMVLNEEDYDPISEEGVTYVLDTYNADRIFVGHTIFDDITFLHNSRVIAVNVENLENRLKQKGRAALIENGTVYVVGNYGSRGQGDPL